jgi:hypothetical protein
VPSKVLSARTPPVVPSFDVDRLGGGPADGVGDDDVAVAAVGLAVVNVAPVAHRAAHVDALAELDPT